MAQTSPGAARLRRLLALGAAAAAGWLGPGRARAEELSPPPQAQAEDQSLDPERDAGEADDAEPRVRRTKWNGFEGRFFTLRVGGGMLYDWAKYIQSEDNKKQVKLSENDKLRDLRLLLKGKLLFAPRISYSLGYMFDGVTHSWRFRQTGLMIDLPEVNADIFVGRTKEGFSTNKIMVGYNGWTIERSAANDAFLPILADGVKWTGRGFGNKLVYNLGYFNDLLSKRESFNKNDMQGVARLVWLPLIGSESQQVLHLALEGRLAKSDDGKLQYRSKPEAFPAESYVVDTGKFTAASSTMVGGEVYYRPGPLLVGAEYFANFVNSPENSDPFFHGGELVVAWLVTGEVRSYNEKGAFFEGVSPRRPVFEGGPGATELVLRNSYVDLDSGPIHGGQFWRITPMINWHLSDSVRLELAYGFSILDRGGLRGGTQYLQGRIQLQFM